VLLLSSTAVLAQSPDNSVSRRVLPPPDAPFTGRVGVTAATSAPSWPARLEAPPGAPNILLIMTDDVGFAASSTFGGPIPTPNLDRLAREGLRYNRFHTTAICSPTRAALLTGRNHHHVGTGMLSDAPLGYPGYDGIIPKADATIAKTLSLNGYSTAMFGKHHNVPPSQQSFAGPFDAWPTGLGFDYFFGFVNGDADKWQPRLVRNVSPIDEPGPANTLLEPRLVDDAIRWVHNQKAAAPDRPFFLYFADPSMHAPHQAPPAWIARFKGNFDLGWDTQRLETYRRQLKAGIVPPGTDLSPRPAQIPAWSGLSAQEKEYQARLMEVAAAELAYEDSEIGRLIDEIDRMGLHDNTLIIFIEGDNGASGEGGPMGTTDEIASVTHTSPDLAKALHRAMPEFGGPNTYENYSVGWAWAMDTPLPWVKQVASHLGGIRNGMVLSWPKRIHDHGAIRSQFSHVIDVAPTLLDAAGLPAPDSVDGIAQEPFDGISLIPTFDRNTPLLRTQYFEMTGNLGIYQDGWFANTTPRRMPWKDTPPQEELGKPSQWELYDLNHDFSQTHNVAAKYPDKLKELQTLWDAEAKRNHVYPVDEFFGLARSLHAGQRSAPRAVYDYWGGDTTVMVGTAPSLAGRSFTITADITIKDLSAGVILAEGSKFGGWSFFLDQGKPVVVHALGQEPGQATRIAGDTALPAGTHRIRFEFVSKGGAWAGGMMHVEADGKPVGEGSIPKTIVIPAGPSETFDIGRDTGAPVTEYRTSEGKFEGTIEHVSIVLAGDALRPMPAAPD
jgi:arylsulfatase